MEVGVRAMKGLRFEARVHRRVCEALEHELETDECDGENLLAIAVSLQTSAASLLAYVAAYRHQTTEEH